MSNSPLLSIIIPHFNNYDIIQDCLESLKKITYSNYEIIVVDNCSHDDSYNLLQKNHNHIKLYKTDYNLGFAGGCNLGSKFADGKYLLFLNNDTVHSCDFIESLISFLENNNNVACVQPKIKNYNDKNYFDYAGASGGFIDYLVYPFCRGRIFDTIEEDENQYDTNMKVFWTSGTAFITRKEIFDKVNGFDEKLFCHMEEIDYCWKSYIMGYENWIIPQSEIYHKGAQTLAHNNPYKTYLNHRNSIILLLTNFQFRRSLLSFMYRFFLEIVSSIYDLIKLKPLHFIYHYKTFFFLLFNIPYLLKRRNFINKMRLKDDEKIFNQKVILNKSIVKNYFLLNKKYFNNNY